MSHWKSLTVLWPLSEQVACSGAPIKIYIINIKKKSKRNSKIKLKKLKQKHNHIEEITKRVYVYKVKKLW